jgi:death on curing protein
VEDSGQAIIYPSRAVIIRHNRRIIEETQGFYSLPENLLHPGSLEWVLEVVQYPLYGLYLFPTIAEKASIFAWIIIADHVFYDGNKRTGMFVMETFLLMNGYGLAATVEEIVATALNIANQREKNYSLSDLVNWVEKKIKMALLP